MLLVRRDAKKDFTCAFHSKAGVPCKYEASLLEGVFEGHCIRIPLVTRSFGGQVNPLQYVEPERQLYYSTEIIFRHNCKSHFEQDRRIRLLTDTLAERLPNASNPDAELLFYARYFLTRGFKLGPTLEKELLKRSFLASDMQEAKLALADEDALLRYATRSYSEAESGGKAFLGSFVLLFIAGSTYASPTFSQRCQRTLYKHFSTSWGPARVYNTLLAHSETKFRLRDYSPQATPNDDERSNTFRDNRLALLATLVAVGCEFGSFIMQVFRAQGLSWDCAIVMAFLNCEIRKYFRNGAPTLLRALFRDPRRRARFKKWVVQEFGLQSATLIPQWVVSSEADDDETVRYVRPCKAAAARGCK